MVYTGQDYINILKDLLDEWKIEGMKNLNDKAERARDYLMKLPDRLQRISDRIATPQLPYSFKWVKS
jgi:acyl-[acyl-carrier-protein] desaturase